MARGPGPGEDGGDAELLQQLVERERAVETRLVEAREEAERIVAAARAEADRTLSEARRRWDARVAAAHRTAAERAAARDARRLAELDGILRRLEAVDDDRVEALAAEILAEIFPELFP